MNNSNAELFAVRFAECIARLKMLDLKGDVAVVSGVVMVSTDDKGSASIFRKAIKKAAGKAGAIYCENRPRKGFSVFTVKAS